MRVAVAILAGIAAVIAISVLANFVFMIATHWIWRDVPDVVIGWSPHVWMVFRDRPVFWVAAMLSFFVTFKITLRRLKKRATNVPVGVETF